MRFASAAGIECVARIWKAFEPDRPSAQAIAGTQETAEGAEDPFVRGAFSSRAKTSHPNKNAIVRHSKAGIVSARSASVGHVAHSGIASMPTHVQARGESGRHRLDGGLSDPNQTATVKVTGSPWVRGGARGTYRIAL